MSSELKKSVEPKLPKVVLKEGTFAQLSYDLIKERQDIEEPFKIGTWIKMLKEQENKLRMNAVKQERIHKISNETPKTKQELRREIAEYEKARKGQSAGSGVLTSVKNFFTGGKNE